MRFIIVGAGPTGVELAGALAELAHSTLKDDFDTIDPAETEILLLEGEANVLPPYPSELSSEAQESLEDLSVTVRTGTLVTDIEDDVVTVRVGVETDEIRAQTGLWAAGM